MGDGWTTEDRTWYLVLGTWYLVLGTCYRESVLTRRKGFQCNTASPPPVELAPHIVLPPVAVPDTVVDAIDELDELELLHHFALHHADAILFDDVLLLGLLDEVAKHGEDDATHFLFLSVGENVRQDGDDAEFVHFLGDPGVECQYPETERELRVGQRRQLL